MAHVHRTLHPGDGGAAVTGAGGCGVPRGAWERQALSWRAAGAVGRRGLRLRRGCAGRVAVMVGAGSTRTTRDDEATRTMRDDEATRTARGGRE